LACPKAIRPPSKKTKSPGEHTSVSPFDIITPLHNAFRRDIGGLDPAVYEVAKSGGNIAPMLERLQAVDAYLRIQAGGEDDVPFPALEAVAPNVAKAFFLDNRELDSMTEDTEKVMISSNELEASRGMAGLWTHPPSPARCGQHPARDDAEPHRMVHGKHHHDERETTARMADVDARADLRVVKGMIQASLTNDDWADLTKCIPEL